jgi:uncharacterized membrane protein
MAFRVVITLAVIYVAFPFVTQADLWFEAAKAAMSAIAIGFFGVIVGFFVNARDEERGRQRQQEYRRAFLLDDADAYSRVKAAARAMGVPPR